MWPTNAPISPTRSTQSRNERGNAGSPKSRSHSPYTLRCSLPRNTFQLPIMCARTKPSSMMPVSAITHFLPTAERQNRTRK